MTDKDSTITESSTTFSGLRVYEYSPSTPKSSISIILVHGGMDRGRSFRRLATQLAHRGIRVVTYDRRGYGNSLSCDYEVLEDAPTFEDHLTDLATILVESPGLVFGHSIGGTISLAAVAKSLIKPIGLVTYEAPLPFMDFWRQSGPYSLNRNELNLEYAANFAAEFMVRMVGDEVWSRLPPSTREQRIAEGPTLVSEMSTAAHYQNFEPSSITTPTLICCGSIAPRRHLRATEYLAGAIPNAKSKLIEDANHGIHLSKPAVMAEIIANSVFEVEL